MDTRPQEGFGVTHVEQVVVYDWKSGWQELNRRNDDVTDGLILIRRKGRDTGDIVFVQIKCGAGYRQDTSKRPDSVCVNVGSSYILKHRPRWDAVPGPMVMIYIDPSKRSSPDAFWTDLRDPGSFSQDNQQVILFPKRQRFGIHSKGDVAALCRNTSVDRVLPLVQAKREDINYAALSAKAKDAARKFYLEWRNGPESRRMNPALGSIEVSRVGWRHMNRKGRKAERILSSWGLLGVAKRIVQEVSSFQRLGRQQSQLRTDGSRHILDYLALRARVSFPHRTESVVQVVLQRKRTIAPSGDVSIRHWFYSVYELRRGSARGY
ncbi:DUF4365 domain-containing protein [Archangium violaceum]|uniref:DUF4365 domain-containing protein n=1 Tax=Archangium violaceum TaxID=83451 RepID=UPI000949B01C